MNIARRFADAFRAFRGGYDQLTYSAIMSPGGFGLSSGDVPVTRQSAETISGIRRGVNLISGYVGKTPCVLKAGRVPDRTHPAHNLVRWWAWKYRTSAFEFRRTLITHAIWYGNGYGYIKRLDGEPVQLRILGPHSVAPYVENGKLGYLVAIGTDEKGKPRTISDALRDPRELDETLRRVAPQNIIDIRGMGEDGLRGHDLFTYGAEVLGLAIAQQTFAAKYFQNGGAPSLAIEVPQSLSDPEWRRLVGQFGRIGTGLDRHHEPAVIDAGGSIKSITPTADDTQLTAAREMTLVDVANLLNMPALKLNAKTNVSYKSLEEENAAFRDDTLDPWLCQFECEYRKLLSETEQQAESHEFEFARELLRRSSLADLGEYLSKAVGGPWMEPNEAREIINMPDTDGGDGLLQPMNMAEAGELDAETPATVAPSQEDRALPAPVPESAKVDALEDVVRRCSKRLSDSARKAAKKSKTFPDWLATLENKHGRSIRDVATPVATLCGIEADDVVAVVLSESRSVFDSCYCHSTPAQFESAVSDAAVKLEESSRDRAVAVLSKG